MLVLDSWRREDKSEGGWRLKKMKSGAASKEKMKRWKTLTLNVLCAGWRKVAQGRQEWGRVKKKKMKSEANKKSWKTLTVRGEEWRENEDKGRRRRLEQAERRRYEEMRNQIWDLGFFTF
jgi:hypothetical protein